MPKTTLYAAAAAVVVGRDDAIRAADMPTNTDGDTEMHVDWGDNASVAAAIVVVHDVVVDWNAVVVVVHAADGTDCGTLYIHAISKIGKQ